MTLTNPQVTGHLIADEGEIVVDEVRRHPIAFVVPVLLILLGLVVMISTLWVPPSIVWGPLGLGLAIGLIGGYRALAAHMDRFVITNMRVFRVHGIVAQHTATMPMARILDISVHKPLLGRIFRYGHFVFESAAQDQGLRDIRFVGSPDKRDLTIQRVIQRSGLRSSMRPLGPNNKAPTHLDDVPGNEVDDAPGDDTPDETPNVDSASETNQSHGANDDQPDSEKQEWDTMEIELPSASTDQAEELRLRRLRSDPVSAAATTWEQLWPERPRMEAVTSLMRVHRLLVTELDNQLRPVGLSFARFEVLLLLSFSPRGALPLVELMERVQVQATSATALVKRMEEDGLINRVLQPDHDDEVFAEVTPEGRRMTDRASQIIADARFGLGSLSEDECEHLTESLAWPRMAAGDF